MKSVLDGFFQAVAEFKNDTNKDGGETMETKKTWMAPKLSVHGDMARITLERVKKGGAGDNLAAQLSWISCSCK